MPKAANDLTGMTFADGMIRVLSRAKGDGNRHAKWLCQCRCGKQFVEYGLNLKSGKRRSCGCTRKPRESTVPKQAPSPSMARLTRDGDPYQNLANAIIATAVDDYRFALREEDDAAIHALENFFHSEWCHYLTNVDPERLIDMVRRENSGDLGCVYI